MIFPNIANFIPAERTYLTVGLSSDTYDTLNHVEALHAVSEHLHNETKRLLNDTSAYKALRKKLTDMQVQPIMFMAVQPVMHNSISEQKPIAKNERAKKTNGISVSYDLVVIVEPMVVGATE